MNYLVRDRDVIFNLAGQVSHIDSMRDPYTDLEINCRSQLTILEACRYNNPGVKVVFAGTRQVYGRPDSLPVDEAHLVRPTDVNGINKAAGEYYHLVYNNVFGVRACSLRLTNVYGPRQLIRHNRQGFIGWFIRLAIEDADDPDLRRRLAAARFRLRGRCGRCVPAGRRERRLQRRGVQRRRRRADQPSRSDDAAGRDRRHRAACEYVDWPAGEEGDRHRRLLRRLVEVQAGDRLDADGAAARRAARGPSRSTASTSTATSTPTAEPRSARDARRAFRSCRSCPREDAAAVRARDRPRRRERLVRPRPRSRGVRSGVRRGDRARRTRSASAPAPTRSR